MPFGKSKIDMNEVINIELEKGKYILWKEQKKNKSSLKKMEGREFKSTIDDDDNNSDDCYNTFAK